MEKNTKPTSVTLLIIDESGSMSGMNSYVLETFSGIRKEIEAEKSEFPELTQYITVWTFASGSITECLPLTDTNSSATSIIPYKPGGSTPLLDAMGKTLTKLKINLDEMELNSDNCRVSVVIITDGAENSSREFTAIEIQLMVEQLEQQGWEFSYYGTDHDVKKMAELLAIKKFSRFSKNAGGFNAIRENQIASEKFSKQDFLKKFK